MNETGKKAIRTPKQKRSIETKFRILNAAKKLFSEKGFYATNSKEIASAAGVAIGSFYSYFEEKEPLFLEILEDYYRQINEQISVLMTKELSAEPDLRKIIPFFIHTVATAHDVDPKFHRESLALQYSIPKVQQICKQEEERIIQNLTSFLKKYHDQIKIKDIEIAAVIIRHSIETVVHSIALFDTQFEKSRMLAELTCMISSYLFNPYSPF